MMRATGVVLLRVCSAAQSKLVVALIMPKRSRELDDTPSWTWTK